MKNLWDWFSPKSHSALSKASQTARIERGSVPLWITEKFQVNFFFFLSLFIFFCRQIQLWFTLRLWWIEKQRENTEQLIKHGMTGAERLVGGVVQKYRRKKKIMSAKKHSLRPQIEKSPPLPLLLKFGLESILDDFWDLKELRVPF